ncbi:MAG: hypothetical protein INR71_07380, partial [Terriglobus roseus]|nr:hypothetical protein [Terriglobus roseus]
MLAAITPKLMVIIGDNDRIVTAGSSMSTNVIGPAVHSKHFPENVSRDTAALMHNLSAIPQASKSWRKDVSDAFNDARFFNMPLDLVNEHWLRIIFQLNVVDKERMAELLSRLTAPATAGIVFGVGAASARQAADRTAQLNLRRVATLVLACPVDTFASKVGPVAEKVAELLAA